MSFRRRNFPEVLDNLLSSITGGVSAEAHPFPPPGASAPPYRHSLQQPPVADVISVYGSRDGQTYLFRKNIDYKLLSDKQTLEWQKGTTLPDPGTLLQINYYPTSAQPALTDIQVGSVLRALTESVALEVARMYAQLEVVYKSGFLDTANGSSLDNVVALLGIQRIRGGKAEGIVEFTRAAGSRGAVTIPAGTRVSTSDGKIKYETTATVTLADGQNTIRVGVRDLEANKPLPAGALTVMPVPVAGISGVSNPAPTAIATQDETDDQLRARAQNFLHGSERATLGAIKQALFQLGITADVDEVPDAAGSIQRIEITPHADTIPPDLQQKLMDTIEAVRPAGVKVILKGVVPPKKVNLSLRLTTENGLLEQDLRAIQHTVQDRVRDYFVRLPSKQAGSLNGIVGQILNIPKVKDVRVLSATIGTNGSSQNVLDTTTGQLAIEGFTTELGDLQIADPNLPAMMNVIVSYPDGSNPPDQAAIQQAVSDTITYINALNASELAANAPSSEKAKRALSYGKLLLVTPLPDKPAASLQAFDTATAPPALPSESTVEPYKVKFVFTLESGLSRILAQANDEVYTLTPFERLALNSVEVEKEAVHA